MSFRFLLASSLVSLLAACSASSTPDTGAATADYSSFTLLAKDTFACTLTDGHSTTTATLTRDLAQSKTDPNERLFSEALHIGEPVFTAALKKFGSYGCAHQANEGLDYSSRADHYAPTTLPTTVTFSWEEGLQWNNCEYEGTESAEIVDGPGGPALTVVLARHEASVKFTGTCAPSTN